MLKQSYGKIINTASMAGTWVPHPQKQATYNASKAAVVQLTRSLATEWARNNINVNSISPGYLNTALIQVLQIVILAHSLACSATRTHVWGRDTETDEHTAQHGSRRLYCR